MYKKEAFLVSLILLSIAIVGAYELNATVYDFNTNATISTADLSLSTSTYTASINVTDGLGFASLYGNGTYSLNTTKSGYHQRSDFIFLSGDGIKEVRLYPSNTDGIFRDRFIDLTIPYANKTICLYYASNHRLKGCYSQGMNITTNENINYTLIVEESKLDQISNLKNIEVVFLTWAIPIGAVIMFGGLLWYLIIKKR